LGEGRHFAAYLFPKEEEAITNDVIRRVARAIYWAEVGAQKADKSKSAQYDAMARAAIETLQAAQNPQAPEGVQ
jgi:hypothetical protein